MSRRGRSDFISVIPEDLQLFEATDTIKVFEYLEKEFHLSKDWHIEFKKELLTVERGISEQEFFFRYACEHIDPALQRILRRKESVIFALSRYLIRHRIAEKRRQDKANRDFYHNGDWKKA
jgi:hypothetical protein